jgi:hypothetical protein
MLGRTHETKLYGSPQVLWLAHDPKSPADYCIYTRADNGAVPRIGLPVLPLSSTCTFRLIRSRYSCITDSNGCESKENSRLIPTYALGSISKEHAAMKHASLTCGSRHPPWLITIRPVKLEPIIHDIYSVISHYRVSCHFYVERVLAVVPDSYLLVDNCASQRHRRHIVRYQAVCPVVFARLVICSDLQGAWCESFGGWLRAHYIREAVSSLGCQIMTWHTHAVGNAG